MDSGRFKSPMDDATVHGDAAELSGEALSLVEDGIDEAAGVLNDDAAAVDEAVTGPQRETGQETAQASQSLEAMDDAAEAIDGDGEEMPLDESPEAGIADVESSAEEAEIAPDAEGKEYEESTGEFELEEPDVVPTSHLLDDLDLDSIDAIDLAVQLEQRVGLELEEEQLRSLRVVQDVVDLVYGTLEARDSAGS